MRKRIERIYHRARKPFNALWNWAKAPERKRRRYKRWSALADFANAKRNRNRTLGRLVRARAWAERRTVYRKKARFLKEQLDKPDVPSTGVFVPARPWNPYGKPIAAWMVPWLDKSWDAGWRGVVNSGYRTPEYSEQLCYAMCGAPSCPGRCAGRATNHAKHVFPDGAVDVSDYYNFGAIQRRIGSGLWNALGAADPVHFSRSGR